MMAVTHHTATAEYANGDDNPQWTRPARYRRTPAVPIL